MMELKFDNSNPGKDVSSSDLNTNLRMVSSVKSDHCVKVESVCFSQGKTIVIAGPNLVESQDLILEIAKSVKSSGAQMLRGGAFKPLTFPYRSSKYFETGEKGLKWLRDAGQTYGLPVVSEATGEENLELVAEHVSMIQIGARNMQNYILLKKAASYQKPILLKRGLGSSLRDFLGAAEYILHEGNDQVVLCERGVVVPHTHRSTSRYLLDLQIIPAVKEITNLPIITDPSHATFWAPWVPSMALASVAAGANGVMLEVHPNPSVAAVDPLQPLDLNQASSLISEISKLSQFLK